MSYDVARVRGLFPSLGDGPRDVVAIAHASLVRVARAHRMPGIVEKQAGEERFGMRVRRAPGHRLIGKPYLHLLEQVAWHDGFVLPRMNLAPIHHLADVEAIPKNMRQRSAAPCRTAQRASVGQAAIGRRNAAFVQRLD